MVVLTWVVKEVAFRRKSALLFERLSISWVEITQNYTVTATPHSEGGL